MKIQAMLFLLATVAFTQAANFKCLSKRGWGYGTGRYSQQGEYSSYWQTYAQAGEYILFQYNGYGKVYWFRADKCEEI